MASDDLVLSTAQPAAVFKKIATHSFECGRLLSYLVDPDSPESVVYDFVVALKDRFHERSLAIQKKPALIGHDRFEKITLGAGIVKTLFQIAKNGKMTMEGVFTSYFAAEGLWNLIVIGNPEERRKMMREFVEKHDVVNWCLNTASSATFVCQRVIGVMGLRLLVTQCFLDGFLTIEKTSEVMTTLCQCILSGPKLWMDQMKAPATTWQSFYCFGTVGTPISRARRYAPRYYALFQEHAAWAIINLVGRYPVPKQHFFNDLIRHNPQLLDSLLECAKTKRSAWYPQLEVDARMVEAVVFMLNIPPEIVPGLALQVDDRVLQERLERRWGDLMEGVGLLTARPNWCRLISDAWVHIIEENPSDVVKMLMVAPTAYHATEPYNPMSVFHTMMIRGTFRIAVLRLITTILHAAGRNPQAVSDVDILNLLHTTQDGCQVLRTEDEMQKDLAFEESLDATAKTTTAFHKPGPVNPALVNGTEEQVEQINDELVTGPICHIQLYIALARRGLFDKVAQWETAPEGLAIEGGLPRLKQLTSEVEVRRSLSISVKRVVERREAGNKFFREKKQLDNARFDYWSAAELATALVEFGRVSNGKYTELIAGTRKELVLNLGNAAEMSLGQGYFDRALVFATAAVQAAEGGSRKDDVGQSVTEKNQRRIKRAGDGMKMKREAV